MGKDQAEEGHYVDVSEVVTYLKSNLVFSPPVRNRAADIIEEQAAEIERLRQVIQTYSDTYER